VREATSVTPLFCVFDDRQVLGLGAQAAGSLFVNGVEFPVHNPNLNVFDLIKGIRDEVQADRDTHRNFQPGQFLDQGRALADADFSFGWLLTGVNATACAFAHAAIALRTLNALATFIGTFRRWRRGGGPVKREDRHLPWWQGSNSLLQ
jgi:hypothetical protein